jgi:hypothetical protein
MGSTGVVAAARHSLERVGAYRPVPLSSAPPADLQREAMVGGQRAAGADHVILMPSTTVDADLTAGSGT